jgi:hypothetical protein
MNAVTTGVVTLLCVYGGALIGLSMQRRLPDHHLSDHSKDIVKLVTGLIATLSALVLGLLIASAKSSFDRANESIRQTAAKIVVLDRVLGQYGPDAGGIREQLKHAYGASIARRIRDAGGDSSPLDAMRDMQAFEALQASLRTLKPTDDAQSVLLSRAQQLAGDVAQARWVGFEEGVNSMPHVFLAVLISWTVMIFASFGLLAARNATAVAALLIGALSVAMAIFLIEELDHPFAGWITVSSVPMRNAFGVLGQ